MTEETQQQLEEAKQHFFTGENFFSQHFLGMQQMTNDGVRTYCFRLWAPNAQAVWLVGDFNEWQDTLPLQAIDGFWEIQTSAVAEGQLYKYKVRQADGTEIVKIDPFALVFEKRPGDAAVIHTVPQRKWKDALWLGRRRRTKYFNRPLAIYEVHASSWKHHPDGSPYRFSELTKELIPYLVDMNFTAVEFMPLMEHPLGDSWGYQLIGYYALSSYYGTPEEFQEFVETCHLNNIAVLVDWVPGHFCANADTLPLFDGTAQFEYADPDRAKNVRWGAVNFDLGKPEVQSFLISSAMFWLDFYHIDGLRVDAVSSVLYRDYDEGPWQPNHEGGNRNFEGFYFLQKLNAVLKLAHPDILMIAEESSSETKITGTLEMDALGFDYKWNMGWMNDVLRFYEMDPLYRGEHFNLVTFSFMYMLNENFILPLSHDEVVHGKKSLMHKMWGDRTQQFAQLRNLYTYFMTHPGKKLLFMGSEWGQFLEWKFDEGLEWRDLADSMNHDMQQFTKQLNHFYTENRALWELDDQAEMIEIIDADNTAQSVLSYLRQGKRKKDYLIVVLNMTPIEQPDFSIGVPYPGTYQEVFNSEMSEFGGFWQAHNPDKRSEPVPFKQFAQRIQTTIPAFGALIIAPKDVNVRVKR